MQCVYILASAVDKELYVGCTRDLKSRLALHNAGRVKSTQKRVPLNLIYCEIYENKHDAFVRE